MKSTTRLFYNNTFLSDNSSLLTYTNPDSIWNGLSAYYRLENNVLDSVGTAHGDTYDMWSSSGRNNSCAVFEDNKYISIPLNSGIFSITDFSISLWFNPSTDYHFGNLIKKAGDFYINYHIYTNTDTQTLLFDMRTVEGLYVSTLASGLNITKDVWHHVVATFNTIIGTKLYFDGSMVNSRPFLGIPQADPNNVIIGGVLYDYYFNGKIDEVGFWKRTLLDSEVSILSYGLFY